MTGDGSGTVTSDPNDVEVLLNGEKATVTSVDGTTGEIYLAQLPQSGDTLVASYYYNRTDTLVSAEDLSDQVDGTATTFKTFYKPIVEGDNGGTTTTDVTKVTVTVDGVPTVPASLDGTTGEFTLSTAPSIGQVLLITYYTNQWQNTWDLLPNTIERVIRVGNYPGKTDYFENQDFVTWQDKIYIKGINLFQACQIVFKRISHAKPKRNVGRDVEKNMVSSYKDLLFILVETHMPGGVSRGFDASKAVISNFHRVAFFQDTKVKVAL